MGPILKRKKTKIANDELSQCFKFEVTDDLFLTSQLAVHNHPMIKATNEKIVN